MSDEEYPSRGATDDPSPSPSQADRGAKTGAVSWIRDLIKKRASNSNNLQEAIDEYIEELKEDADVDNAAADSQKVLISNILKTNDLRVADVMIPRADIVALDMAEGLDGFAKAFKDDQFSRFPVYRGNLDDVAGIVHIKDVLACFLERRDCELSSLVRDVEIVSPGMPVMELFLMMRQEKKHMAMVVDEHGGIDGLVTLGDVIEAIVGDLEDEFDNDEEPEIVEKADGSIVADARIDIEDFEERYGEFLSEEEREDVDTLAGLAYHMAGHIPKRGEFLKHPSGLVLEILDANAKSVKRVRVRNLAKRADMDSV